MRPALLVPAALLLPLAACSSPSGPGEEQGEVLLRGAIAGYNEGDPFVEVPAAAQRGVPFPVVVRTYGGGCHRKGSTEVRTLGATVEVAPYDYSRPGAICTQQLVSFTHTATVRFDAAGTGRVRVRGLDGVRDTAVVVERTVEVR